MSERDEIITLVREWVAKAESDLKTAVLALRAGKDCPTDTTCFHAQQCVGKYFKAVLELHQVAFPRTHDVEALASRLPADVRSPLTAAEHDRLTAFATFGRYPGFPDIALKDAKRVVVMARLVRREMRKKLPRSALKRPDSSTSA